MNIELICLAAAAVATLAATVLGIMLVLLRAKVADKRDEGTMRLIDARDLEQACADRMKELEELTKRYPLLLKMDKLAGHALLELLEAAPDDILQAMALGGASLVAHGDEQLETLCVTKSNYLAGDMTEDQAAEALAATIEKLAYPEDDYTRGRDLTARERAVISGCSLNGHSAVTLLLKHVAEVNRDGQTADREEAAEPESESDGVVH